MTPYGHIKKYYGNDKGTRSNVPYINHIDEGCYLLYKWGASRQAIEAFALHPLIQLEGDFYKNKSLAQKLTYDPDTATSMALAVEYRRLANAFTSKMKNPTGSLISPLEEVNLMLKADKIQNSKDAHRYVIPNYPEDAQRLTEYFMFWENFFADKDHPSFEDEIASLDEAFPINYNASTLEEVRRYVEVRAAQLPSYDLLWLFERDGGVESKWRKGEESFYSFYVYEQCRGQGFYKKWAASWGQMEGFKVLTTTDCEIHSVLDRLNIPYEMPWLIRRILPNKQFISPYCSCSIYRSPKLGYNVYRCP